MRAALVAISGSFGSKTGISEGFGSALRFGEDERSTDSAWGMFLPAANAAGNCGRLGKLLGIGTGMTGQVSTRGRSGSPESVEKLSVPFACRLTKRSALFGCE